MFTFPGKQTEDEKRGNQRDFFDLGALKRSIMREYHKDRPPGKNRKKEIKMVKKLRN